MFQSMLKKVSTNKFNRRNVKTLQHALTNISGFPLPPEICDNLCIHMVLSNATLAPHQSNKWSFLFPLINRVLIKRLRRSTNALKIKAFQSIGKISPVSFGNRIGEQSHDEK